MGIFNWLWTLVVITTVPSICAQVGLRTAPLTAPRIRHHNDNNNRSNRTGGAIFSKWPSLEMGHRRGGSGKIESELAAIFRGVAYGVSTLPPTTVIPSTTTSSTTSIPLINNAKNIPILPNQSDNNQKTLKDNQAEQGHASLNPINFPEWRESEFPQAEIHQVPSQKSPNQHPHAESSDVDKGSTRIHKSKPRSGVTDVQVFRADGTEVEWIQKFGVTWFIHVYTAAVFYSILAILAIMWIIRVKVNIYLLSTGYYIIIQVLMFVATILRSVHLFHDPYGAEHRLSQPLSKVVEETAWPCLTAAIAVVVIAIVRSWQCPRLVPQHNYVPLGLALITTVHLLITLTSLLTAYLVPDQAPALNAASRTVTLAWGSTVGLCGLFATWKVGRVSQKHNGQLSLRHEINHLQTGTPCHNSRAVLSHGTNLVLVICLAQISLAGLHLYALVGPHYILDIPPMYPWFWMVYQSTARILEILSWVLLCATSALKLGTSTIKHQDSSGETKLLTVLGCQCCGPSTSIATQDNVDDDMYADMCQTHRSVRNFNLLNYGKGEFQGTLAHPLMGNEKPVIRIEQKLSLNNSLVFQDNNPDEHMYWDSSSVPKTSVTPSSMITNESGFVRFQMNNEQSQVVDEVLRKSLKNLDLVSQIHDLKIQKLKSSQNQLNTSEYSDDPPPYEKNPSSAHLSRKPSIGSPQFQRSDNLDLLLQNHNIKMSLSNPSSPQPTSDIEVSQYYQNPSTSSYHTYASLHRPSSHAHQSQEDISYRLPNNGIFDNNEPNKGKSRALSSPKKSSRNKLSPTYVSPTKNLQNINANLSNSNNIHQFKKSASLSPSPKRSPHFNLRHGTPDSGLAMDYYGYTDNNSGDDMHIDSNNAQISSRLHLPNQEMQQYHQYIPQNYRGGVKSIELIRLGGNHTQCSQRAESTSREKQSPVMIHINTNNEQPQSPLLSPSRPPLHPGSPILQEKQRLQLQHQLQKRIQDEQLRQQNQEREKQLKHQRLLEQNKSLRPQTERSTLVSSINNLNRAETDSYQSSPLLIRLSSNGSNSNLPSQCLDLKDEIKRNQITSVENKYENVSEPDVTEAWPPPSRLINQAAV